MEKNKKVFETFTNQSQWKEYIQNLIKYSDKALFRAIVCVYDLQTFEEKQKSKSIEDNQVGFGKIDAKILGEIAEKVKHNRRLSDKEMAIARNKMPKYWRQLMEISKENLRTKREQMKKIERCLESNIPCSYAIDEQCPIWKEPRCRECPLSKVYYC